MSMKVFLVTGLLLCIFFLAQKSRNMAYRPSHSVTAATGEYDSDLGENFVSPDLVIFCPHIMVI